MYKIIYYRTSDGKVPLQEFLARISIKARVKIRKHILLLSYEGPNLRRPYADYLRDGIYELRVKLSPNNYRVLYFFFSGKNIVMSHGFVKKTAVVPNKEILRALKHKFEYERRYKER